MSKTALVAGPTGFIGQLLIPRLLRHGAYNQVRALSRRPLAHDEARLRTVIAEYSCLEAQAAELRADDVFCCLGTTMRAAGSREAFERVDLDMVVELARVAHQAGARQFLVVSAAGASLRAGAYYSRVKARMEQAVSQIPFETVHIVRPSLLLGERAESRPGERLAQLAAPLFSRLMAGPLLKYRPVRGEDVADALVRLAQSGQRGVHVHHLPLDA